jgi:hypothetical protein
VDHHHEDRGDGTESVEAREVPGPDDRGSAVVLTGVRRRALSRYADANRLVDSLGRGKMRGVNH